MTIQSAVDQYWVAEENERLQALLTARSAELERLNRELDAKLEQRTLALKNAARSGAHASTPSAIRWPSFAEGAR